MDSQTKLELRYSIVKDMVKVVKLSPEFLEEAFGVRTWDEIEVLIKKEKKCSTSDGHA